VKLGVMQHHVGREKVIALRNVNRLVEASTVVSKRVCQSNDMYID
jgi:hypothetical protein